MAPQTQLGKRMKGVQMHRPFIYGTTAKPFDDKHNPKPPGVPDDHTHSWQVFIKGIDDTDITYWLRRVQFKLHESIPNHVRMVEGEPGKPFVVHETGWGEFEITLKLYYVAESGEKPQTLYHHLRLHPYGRTEEEKEAMRVPNGEVKAWIYEEQLFNEPYESFYDHITQGAHPKGFAGGAAAAIALAQSSGASGTAGSASGASTPTTVTKGKGKTKAAAAAAAAAAATMPPLPDPHSGAVWERSALLPVAIKSGAPFSREAEKLEMTRLEAAALKATALTKKMQEELRQKEAALAKLKEENAKAALVAKSKGAGVGGVMGSGKTASAGKTGKA
ncbi:hypothetical protein CFO_g790 [Ceratocystis platani]|uniref:Protein AF-9 homolog n=1 Tax=Ceratocystis fimbriata f. sp. platani TaxID=88771 RepID=A0A0F8BWF2_CERFI|nr:hypothetical protein CFO_g790 [Ceratocystis platani]